MALINVKIEPKPKRKKHEDYDVWSKSSDITTFNLYEQTWETLVVEGLSRLFDGQADFEHGLGGDEKCGARKNTLKTYRRN